MIFLQILKLWLFPLLSLFLGLVVNLVAAIRSAPVPHAIPALHATLALHAADMIILAVAATWDVAMTNVAAVKKIMVMAAAVAELLAPAPEVSWADLAQAAAAA